MGFSYFNQQVSNISNLVSVIDYASLQGVQPRAVYKRIKARTISHTAVDGIEFIYLKQKENYSSAEKLLLAANKTINFEEKEFVNTSFLITVANYARKAKTSRDVIYENIIAGKIKAAVIGNMVFVDIRYPSPASFSGRRKLRKHR